MIGPNKLVIAAAGSGKTTYLVRQALAVGQKRVLITTYTESNEEEIRRKFFEIHGSVPGNVHIQTWFSLLIEHGIKPFQGKLFDWDVAGMILVSQRSGFRGSDRQGRPMYWGEKDFRRCYFDRRNRVYSDKLSRLMIRCNEASDGAVIERLSRIYPFIFVDEVQDLAGYDLDILTALFRSPANVVMVGDPRQVTYVTHLEARFKKYRDGGIADFIRAELPRKVACDIDVTSLVKSHRNSTAICELSSKLYPKLAAATACKCPDCKGQYRATGDELADLLVAGHQMLPEWPEAMRPHNPAAEDAPPLAPGETAFQTLESAIMAIPNDGSNPDTYSRDWWLTIGAALHYETGGSAEGLALSCPTNGAIYAGELLVLNHQEQALSARTIRP